MNTLDYLQTMSEKIERDLCSGSTKTFSELIKDASNEIKAEEIE